MTSLKLHARILGLVITFISPMVLAELNCDVGTNTQVAGVESKSNNGQALLIVYYDDENNCTPEVEVLTAGKVIPPEDIELIRMCKMVFKDEESLEETYIEKCRHTVSKADKVKSWKINSTHLVKMLKDRRGKVTWSDTFDPSMSFTFNLTHSATTNNMASAACIKVLERRTK